METIIMTMHFLVGCMSLDMKYSYGEISPLNSRSNITVAQYLPHRRHGHLTINLLQQIELFYNRNLGFFFMTQF